MPKRRASFGGSGGGSAGGSLNVVAGGGVGAGGGAVVPSSPEPRDVSPAMPAQTYTVQEFSRTRGRLENMDVTFDRPGRALVRSESGNVYEVTLGDQPACTCPDYLNHAEDYERRNLGGYVCRHIAGVNSALGIAAPASAVEVYAEPPRTNFPAANEAAESAEEAPIDVPAGEPEVSLADDAAFNALMDQVQQGPPSFEYEDVLGDPDATFGVEIEFSGGNAHEIAREMYELGLVEVPRQRGYHSTRPPGMWSFESDASVSGGELVSPVFRDTPEAWRQIEQACDVVRRHGGRVDYRCGSHVHIGSARPLDSDRERWNRIFHLCRDNEDLLYRIAAGGSELGGQHRGTHYARPLGDVEDLVYTDRYRAMNRRANTVEFRYFNGTLDPRQIQTNVRLAHGLTQAAAREETDSRIRGRAMRLGGRVNRPPERERHTEVRRFLDTVFTRTKDKAAVLWLYTTSRWQNRVDRYSGPVPA